MSNSQISKMFNSPELASLYKKGELDRVLNRFHDEINTKTLVGSGGDASVFSCEDEDAVIKLCTKQIRYFKHFGKKGSAMGFQKHINSLDPFFVPVEKILYEDKNVFLYKQRKCGIITSKEITQQVVIDVFRLVQFMLINGILLTDLAPHNLGLLDGQVVVFDYHGLHRLKKKGQIKREYWWKRIARNLTRFICGYLIPDKRKEYANLMQNCNQEAIRKLEREAGLPVSFALLIKYLESHRNKVNLDQVIDLIEDTITDIKATKPKKRHRRPNNESRRK